MQKYNRPLQDIINDIKSASGETLPALQRELITLSKRANVRLAALERAGRARWAYERATLFTQSTTGRNRFFQGKITDKKALRAQFEEVTRFLESRSSTISGQKAIVNERVKRFVELLGLEESPDLTDFVKKVLESGYYNDMKKYVPSDDFNEYLKQVWEETDRFDTMEFVKAMKKVVTGELLFTDLLKMFGVDILK